MKKSLLLCAGISALVSQSTFAVDPSLATEQDKISYSIGVDIGKHFRDQTITIKQDSFMKGIQHGQDNSPKLMNEKEIKETLVSLQGKILEKQQEQRKVLAEKNLKEGKAFLDKNKAQAGFKTTKSGLQYKIITEGKGTAPKATDRVTTHYRGTLIDGTEFDSSYTRGEPVQFTVDGVIPGWTEALQMMKPGAKWQLVIPAALAYGENGVGAVIGPNATLIFDIELIEVNKS